MLFAALRSETPSEPLLDAFQSLVSCIGGSRLETFLDDQMIRDSYDAQWQKRHPDARSQTGNPTDQDEGWLLLHAALKHGRNDDDPIMNIFADLAHSVGGGRLTELIKHFYPKPFIKTYKQMKRQVPKRFPGITYDQAMQQDEDPGAFDESEQEGIAPGQPRGQERNLPKAGDWINFETRQRELAAMDALYERNRGAALTSAERGCSCNS
ncbi:hypothetical protein FSST1_011839 [Fusarium sambucinum]